jgi:DNA-binding SARP family transcriptional activator
VAADTQGIRLRSSHAGLDLLDFLDDAAEAARLADEGDEGGARQLLAELLAGYRGEAFEEDPYETWAEDVRQHVRAAWVQSLRLAARLAGRAGDIDVAVTCLIRLLAADPYDEPAHRMLVAVLVRAGRHGEARRAFDRWHRAMAEVGAAEPDADTLGVVIGS